MEALKNSDQPPIEQIPLDLDWCSAEQFRKLDPSNTCSAEVIAPTPDHNLRHSPDFP
jgi:hypothetical protein